MARDGPAGFRFRPRKPVDWLVCDMVESPRKVAARIAEHRRLDDEDAGERRRPDAAPLARARVEAVAPLVQSSSSQVGE